MAKIKKSYFCQNCGSQSAQWVGKCPSCSEWNTFVEEVIAKSDKKLFSTGPTTKRISKPVAIAEVSDEKHNRIIYSGFKPANWAARGASPKSLIWNPNL